MTWTAAVLLILVAVGLTTEGDTDPDFPHELLLPVDTGSQIIHLLLRLDAEVPDTVIVIQGHHGDFQDLSSLSQEHCATYADADQGAAFTLRPVTMATRQWHVTGVLMGRAGGQYEVSGRVGAAADWTPSLPLHVRTPLTAHLQPAPPVTECEDSEEPPQDTIAYKRIRRDAPSPWPNTIRFTPTPGIRMTPSSLPLLPTSGPVKATMGGAVPPWEGGTPNHIPAHNHYRVDIVFFLHNSIFNKFAAVSRDTAATFRNLKHHYTSVMAGINLRLNSLDQPGFRLRAHLHGLYVARTPVDSPWNEAGQVSHDVDADATLRQFQKWLGEKQDALRRLGLHGYDQATLITGQLLTLAAAGGGRRPISGLAYVGGVCMDGGVAVVKETGLYGCVQTAAHELGHSLGALHDGRDNPCSSDDQHVMAAAPSGLRAHIFHNTFRYSACSAWYIRNHVTNVLYRTGRQCLAVGGEERGGGELRAPSSRGESPAFTPDQQCQLIHGNTSYFCRGGALMCRRLRCWAADRGRCEDSVSQRAFEYTQCGHRQWCQLGRCVRHTLAPSAASTCLYGDYRGRVDGATCDDVRGDPRLHALCYQTAYRRECCVTCPKVRALHGHPACEYGDRDPSYCRSVLPHDCYTPDIRRSCCATCRRPDWHRPNKTGCEWGDGAPWCAEVDRRHCAALRGTCCESCSLTSGLYPGGVCAHAQCDRKWCGRQAAHMCYKSYTRANCGHHCRALRHMHMQLHRQHKQHKKHRQHNQNRKENHTHQQHNQDRQHNQHNNTQQQHTKHRGDTYTQQQHNQYRQHNHTHQQQKQHRQNGEHKQNREHKQRKLRRQHKTHSQNREQRQHKQNREHNLHKQKGEYTKDRMDTETKQHKKTKERNKHPSTDKCEFGDRDPDHCAKIKPRDCYTRQSRDTCCVTCSQRGWFRRKHKGCEWGDRALWCMKVETSECHRIGHVCCNTCRKLRKRNKKRNFPAANGRHKGLSKRRDAPWCHTLKPVVCYKKSVRRACPARCRRLRFNDTDCRYGNRSPEYCEEMEAHHCYTAAVRGHCCSTCARHHNITLTGCEYGDRHPAWCAAVTRRQCYHQQTQRDCCLTCGGLRLNHTECSYGDRFSWCAGEFCSTHSADCCQTCSHQPGNATS